MTQSVAGAWLTRSAAQAPRVRWGCPAPMQGAQVPLVRNGVPSTEAGAQAPRVR
jgi:hypothetical protein